MRIIFILLISKSIVCLLLYGVKLVQAIFVYWNEWNATTSTVPSLRFFLFHLQSTKFIPIINVRDSLKVFISSPQLKLESIIHQSVCIHDLENSITLYVIQLNLLHVSIYKNWPDANASTILAIHSSSIYIIKQRSQLTKTTI